MQKYFGVKFMKIAFVIPWYGINIPGGAESECRNIAINLKKAGIDVEILTTCVKDFHSDWNTNYHSEGEYNIEGMIVHRFNVRKRNTAEFDAINLRLMNITADQLISDNGEFKSPLSQEDEDIFIKEMINSPLLYDYIDKNREKYDYIIPIPYMFGTTYFASQICSGKTLLIPCLHNESYAYMNIFRKMMNTVRGLILLSTAEKRLAKRLYKLKEDKLVVVGGGLDTSFSFIGERFKRKYGLKDPFILYAGRKDITKNTDLLIRHFVKYKRNQKNSNLKLILIGSGNVEILSTAKKEIIDLGFVTSQDKYDAYDAALLLCNPSINESFSIVMMESWLTSTPALVNENCEVTKDHCLASNGGLYFSNYAEFEESLNFLINRPNIGEKMGENGKAYVLNNYSWDIIVHKYQKLFEKLNGSLSTPS